PAEAMKFASMPSGRPLPDVDKHEVFIEYYRNAIKDAVDSDGIENHPLTKSVLMVLIKAHENQGVMDTQDTLMQTMEAQAPQTMMQQGREGDKASQNHAQEMEKSGMAHKQSLEKQAQGSQLKREELAARGAPNKGKSVLNQVKV